MGSLIPAVLVLLVVAAVVTLVVLRATGGRTRSDRGDDREAAAAGERGDRDVPDSERLANRPR